jgi:signal peptidase I
MTDGRSDRPESDELGIRISPVDDEFAERPTDTSPSHRVEPRGAARGPIITDPSLVNREPPRRLTPRITTTAIAEHALSTDRRSVPRLYFEALIGALALWLFVSTFVVQPVAVPTGSMLNTILIGDHLLVNRVVFGSPSWMFPVMPYSTIRRGDVIVFRHPNDPTTLYVKRVIGLPGETLEIYGARVYIDGKELPENRALVKDVASDDRLELASDVRPADGARYTVYFSDLRDLGDSADDEYAGLVSADRGTFGVGKPFTIPSGQYFCMGDNRDNSEDSRFWGTVPRDNIVGRAVGVYWSSANGGSSAVGLPKGIRWSRIGTLIQ